MQSALCGTRYSNGESIDAEDEDYEEDADVVEEEPVEFADPEDDEFELEVFYMYYTILKRSNGQITPIPDL